MVFSCCTTILRLELILPPPANCSLNCSLPGCLLLLERLHHAPQISLDRLFSRPSSNGYATPPNDCWWVDLMGLVQPLLRLSFWVCSTRESCSFIHCIVVTIGLLKEFLFLSYSCRACTLGASTLGAVKTCQSGQPLDRFNFSPCLNLNPLNRC